MPIAVVVITRTGIVLAADTRLLATASLPGTDGSAHQSTVFVSDTNTALWVTPGQVGIAACGQSHLHGTPLTHFMPTFAAEACGPGFGPEQVAQGLASYLAQVPPAVGVQFFVAGHQGRETQVWRVDAEAQTCVRADAQGAPGLLYSGEADALARLLRPAAELDAQGQSLQAWPMFDLALPVFTLHDAVACAQFLVRTQLDLVRFQIRPKLVGGAVEILVLQPGQARWIQRTDLDSLEKR